MLGFACIYLPPAGPRTDYVFTKLTAAKLDQLSDQDADDRVFDGVVKNVQALRRVLGVISQWPEALRMYRITSDLFPMATHPKYRRVYADRHVDSYLRASLSKLGSFSRKHNIKLSMHPGQFVCLASDRDDVIKNSIDELEYHARVAEYMGFGRSAYTDFKINIHCSGRKGVDGFRSTLSHLSDTARRCLTLENDEVSIGIDTILHAKLDRDLPIVLDIHHHWCMTGEHIKATDTRVMRIYDSWSTRPTLHYSCPSESIYCQGSVSMPNRELLVRDHGKSAIRAHSDHLKSEPLNEWALSFYDRFDIMCETKQKNLAQSYLYVQLSKLRRNARI